jgi:hypothetical protein
MNEKPVFKYTTKSRPTVYKDIQFSSELEAAWASLFDLRSIVYEYEPLLDLKSWRPDFHIRIPSFSLDENEKDTFVLAEVKPYLDRVQWLSDTFTLNKIINSFDGDFQVVLLGVSPLVKVSNMVWGRNVNPETAENIHLCLFDPDNLQQDWNRAKSTVKWRP